MAVQRGRAIERKPEEAIASRRSAYRLLPALLAVPTLLLSFWIIIGRGFDGLYGQDPYSYYGYGVGPLRAFLLTGKPLTAMVWPLGYPFLVTLASLVVGTAPLAGQIVSLIAGAAAVPLTYLLAHELLIQSGATQKLARRTGIVAALLLGASGWLVQSSVTIMADSVALFMSLLSAWALTRWMRGGDGIASAGWLGVAGGALAWSVVTRWGQVVLAPVWLVAALPTIRAQPARFVRAVPLALLMGGAVVAAQVWLILTVKPNPALGPLPFVGNLGLVHGTQGAGWSIANLFRRDFLNPDGSQHYALPNLLFYASAAFRPQDLSPLFAPAAFLGFVLVVTRYRRAVPLLVVWPVALLLIDAGLAEQNLRFVLPVLPPVAILAGLGVAAAWEEIAVRWRPLLAAAVLVAWLAVAGVGVRDVGKLVDASNSDLAVARWAAATVPPSATTLSFDITLTLEHVTRMRPLDLAAVSKAQVARLVSQPRPLYLLVRVEGMEGQWALRKPGELYRFLRDGPGLVQLGTMNGYTLFRIQTK